MSDKITVTIDFDALKAHATKIAQDNGGLEASSGVKPEELAYAWDYMSSMFEGVNDAFGDAVSQAIQVLVEVDEEFSSESEGY